MMNTEEAIKDLITLKEFFEEQSGAIPLSLEYAINALSRSGNPNKWIGANVLDKIRAEIIDINVVRDEYSQRQNDYCDGVEFAKRYVLQIIDKYKASLTGAEGSNKE